MKMEVMKSDAMLTNEKKLAVQAKSKFSDFIKQINDQLAQKVGIAVSKNKQLTESLSAAKMEANAHRA